MEQSIVEDPPAGFAPPALFEFDQKILSFDFAYARGPLMVRGEHIRDEWEAPNLEDYPREHSYSLELQWDLWAGISAATRVGYIDFRPLDQGPGRRPVDWDYDVYRYEGSLAYRLARNSGILLSAYRQIQREGEDGDTNLVGARIWWAF